MDATRSYERWMAQHVPIVKSDLREKHVRMARSTASFLRGTFYRWAQIWPERCPAAANAPVVPSVGDLHIANFGTWRDAEGRLIWGINDLDEACRLPHTNDLVRLATSTVLALHEGLVDLSVREVCDLLLDGYRASAERGGQPFVLGERRRWLRRLAQGVLRDPSLFWPKLVVGRSAATNAPHAVLRAALPRPIPHYRVLRRVAGVGSLGRPRFVALAEWYGSLIAREAKASLPSAVVWATGRPALDVPSSVLLAGAVRAHDPFLSYPKGWVVRRLAPDCSRIELEDLARTKDHSRLVRAMGWETANMHPTRCRPVIRDDLRRRKPRWLEEAALSMAEVTFAEWRQWIRSHG